MCIPSAVSNLMDTAHLQSVAHLCNFNVDNLITVNPLTLGSRKYVHNPMHTQPILVSNCACDSGLVL